MKKKSNLVMQASILAFAGVISRFIGIARRFPMEHIIGDKGNGYYSVAYEVYALLLILSCYSLPLAISKVVSVKIRQKKYKSAERVFNCAMIFAVITGIIAVALCELLGDFFASKLMLEPMSAMALKVLAPAILFVSIMSAFRGYFQGLGNMMPTAVSQIIEQLFVLIGSLVGAYTLFGYGEKVGVLMHNADYAPSYGAAGASIGPLVGSFIGMLFLTVVFAIYKKANPLTPHRIQPEEIDSYADSFKLLLLTILPVILSTTIYNISNVIDIRIYNDVMIQKGLGDIKTYNWGVYSGKFRVLINIPIILANAICATLVPTISVMNIKEDYILVRNKIGQAVKNAMYIVIPAVIGLAVLARPILSMMFKGEINLAVNLIHVGAVSAVFYTLSGLSTGILQGLDKMTLSIRNAIIALCLHIAFLYAMLQLGIGINAVVYSNIVFAAIVILINGFYIRRFLNYRQEYIRTFAIPLISAALMGVVVGLLSMLLQKVAGNVITVLLGIIIGVIVYTVAVLLLKGVTEEELMEIPGGQIIILVAKQVKLL